MTDDEQAPVPTAEEGDDVLSPAARPDVRPTRGAHLDMNPVADGYVVYDPERDRVHHLNGTAALILEYSDGAHSPEQIAEIVRETFGLPEAPYEAVSVCIEQLRDEGLVT